MKNYNLVALIIFFICSMAIPDNATAQNPAKAGAYLDAMGTEMRAIMTDTWDYISAVAHSKKANKIETKRKELVTTISNAKKKIGKMPGYEGDNSLRDSVLNYLNISYNIINDDYAKIVDMEAVAEQSYDNMEAYILAQELANDKLDQAGDRMDEQQRIFAKKNNVNIIESKDKLSTGLEKASKAMAYNNSVYLIFFKSYKQEMYLIDAMNMNDVNAMQQNKNALLQTVAEGIAKLDTLKNYKNDPSLKSATRKLLDYYKTEALNYVSPIIDFYIKKENFEKLQKSFNAKAASQRTKQDSDQFNKAVDDYNKSINTYNSMNLEMNKNRAAQIDAWNKSVDSFLAKHVPKYK